MRDSDRSRLRTGANALGVPLDRSQVEAFARYASLLAEWNARMNLTRVPAEEFVERHFLDSLAACTHAGAVQARTVIDVGTGAGLPGVAWKIAYPQIQITLLDSTRKRLDFLEAVVADLALDGVRIVHARAEDAARETAHRARYDIAVARAVAPMERLAGWLVPFVRRGGLAVALKSVNAEAEIAAADRAIRAAGARIESVVRVGVPGTEIERLVVLLRAPGPRTR